MKLLLAPFLFLAACTIASASKSLPRSTPEEQGISSADILKFIEAADSQIDTMHSFMLVRHGHVVAEGWWTPFAPEHRHMVHSLSKSFTSTAVGMAVAEGRVDVDDLVLSFFPEDAPEEPNDFLKAMRLRDLLSMNTGHLGEDLDPMRDREDGEWTKGFLAAPLTLKPGTHFHYNSPASYMCSAIVQKVTGETVRDYLEPRLFEPLGIENPGWVLSPQGITTGSTGIRVRTEDIAKFGQLYLQRGEWNGEQLLPAEWVDEATRFQTRNGSNPDSDWEVGYGYQFWRCKPEPGFYRGDGAHGQYCIVVPQLDTVIAITSGVRNMAEVMDLAWDLLLPALQSDALPKNAKVNGELVERLKYLEVAIQAGEASSPIADEVSGRTYLLSPNEEKIESVSFDFEDDGSSIVFGIAGKKYEVPIGFGKWGEGSTIHSYRVDTRLVEGTDEIVAGSGGWTADDTFSAKLCLYGTAFSTVYEFRFVRDEVIVDREYNVPRDDQERPRAIGRAKDSLK